MMARCYNTSDKNYPSIGGLGLRVCAPWHEFEAFARDMGEKPEGAILARVVDSVGFTQNNCYWSAPVHSRTNPLYAIWKGIRRRCGVLGHAPMRRAGSYAERGITVDPEWACSFAAFAAHVGERPSPKHQLDRIDNAAGYVPGNVRWALPMENANNRYDNVVLEMDGERRTISQWGVHYGINRATLGARFDALFKPAVLRSRGVMQVNPVSGEVLNTFSSLRAASASTGIKPGTLSKCLSGGNATAGGFAWAYTE